jgi:hypothetical protein
MRGHVWFDVAQGRDEWRALMDMVISLRIR